MSLEQAKNLARELGLDEPSRVDPMEAAYKMTDSYYREQMEARAAEAPPDDDGEGAILARDFGMNGQMPESDKPLELITQEILFYKRQAGGAIIEIGKRLLEAKAQLGHGEWLPWLREKVDISERRAQDFMRIAREYSKSAEIADLGASKALALLALPESERERFAGERHLVDGEEKTVSEMTARELKAAIKAREQARREAEERKAEAAAAEASREKMAQDMRQLKELLASARETEQEKSQALEEARRELQPLLPRRAVQVDWKTFFREEEDRMKRTHLDAALSAAAGLLALLISALNFWNQELLLGLLVLLPGWMWMSVVLFFTGVRCGRGKVTKEAETGRACRTRPGIAPDRTGRGGEACRVCGCTLFTRVGGVFVCACCGAVRAAGDGDETIQM